MCALHICTSLPFETQCLQQALTDSRVGQPQGALQATG